ncbi:MAG: AtpZ/AtpI family protein [Bacillota bacterium]
MDNKLLDPEMLKLIKYYGTISVSLAATVVGGLFLGWRLDMLFRTGPVFTMFLFLTGCYAGYSFVSRTVLRYLKKDESMENKDHDEDD